MARQGRAAAKVSGGVRASDEGRGGEGGRSSEEEDHDGEEEDNNIFFIQKLSDSIALTFPCRCEPARRSSPLTTHRLSIPTEVNQ